MRRYFYDIHLESGIVLRDHVGSEALSIQQARLDARRQGEMINRTHRRGLERCVLVSIADDAKRTLTDVRIETVVPGGRVLATRPASPRQNDIGRPGGGDAMARYFFDVHDGDDYPDEEGVELAGVEAARREAVHYAGQLLVDGSERFWDGSDWRMVVRNATGSVVFTLRFIAEEQLASRAPFSSRQAGVQRAR